MHHHAFAHHQPLLGIEIAFHMLFVHDEVFKDVLGLLQCSAEHMAGTRNGFPFGQEAAPVAFVFTHHRFDDGGCNAAHIAAQSQHVFQHRRIALVRHGGGTYLAHEERFFQFKNLGVLQREDFVVDTADRTGANCKCAHELSLVVASNVPSNRRDVQAQDFHHALLRFESLFRLRSKRTDGTGHFTDEHAILHRFETFDVASEFISPNGSLVAERDRNGMHDVRTAGLSGIAILLGQRQAVLKALLHVAQDHLISVAFEQHQTRVHDILARRTPVYEFARVIRLFL